MMKNSEASWEEQQRHTQVHLLHWWDGGSQRAEDQKPGEEAALWDVLTPAAMLEVDYLSRSTAPVWPIDLREDQHRPLLFNTSQHRFSLA